jgi:hypothetical protein
MILLKDIAKGIARWLVDIYDETGETVAMAPNFDDGKEEKAKIKNIKK